MLSAGAIKLSADLWKCSWSTISLIWQSWMHMPSDAYGASRWCTSIEHLKSFIGLDFFMHTIEIKVYSTESCFESFIQDLWWMPLLWETNDETQKQYLLCVKFSLLCVWPTKVSVSDYFYDSGCFSQKPLYGRKTSVCMQHEQPKVPRTRIVWLQIIMLLLTVFISGSFSMTN